MFSKYGKSKKPAAKKADSAYESKRAAMAERSVAQSKAGRDIGELPAVVNPERKATAAKSLEFYLRTYFPETFPLPWSNDHREVIESIQQHAIDGGLDAYAMPRGGGKTSIAERATMWILAYGYRKYVPIIGADDPAATALLETIKTEFESNELLAEDFPEICYPIQKLERSSARCRMQTHLGNPTYMVWTESVVVLPTIAGSAASGAIIEVRGLTCGIRGMKFTRPNDGKTVRPDFVLIDDAQTDESSRSPSQCAERIRTIRKAILGLAGPGKRMSGVLTATIINRGDMADQILDRNTHPEWHGKRMKMLYAMPTNDQLWDQYKKIRADEMRAGNGQKTATDFYRANQPAMDAGAKVAWPARYASDEVSALQNAMNLKADMGDAAFASEYQNEPLAPEENERDVLTVNQIAAKINNRPRGIVPHEATKLVAFIDVQKNGFPFVVGAIDEYFSPAIIDYGFWPEQNEKYYTRANVRRTAAKVLKSKSMEETIYQGLQVLVGNLLGKEWIRDGGQSARIDLALIDFGWGDYSDVVIKFCKESAFAATIVPSKGFGVSARSTPFDEYKRKPGDEVGDHWRRPAASKRNVRHVLFDSNYWKSFVAERWAVEAGGNGCLSIFGNDPEEHRMFADHQLSETGTLVAAKGRQVTEWELKPSRPDNDLLDGVVGVCVGASMLKLSLTERVRPKAPARKRVSFAEMARKAGLTGGVR